jgi:ribonuclease P protein component
MRFRPEQHLSRQSDTRAVREQGRRVECRAFTMWWRRRDVDSTPAATPAPPISRVCVVASTAAVGHAVLRNRAKRRLREVFRHQQQLVPPGCDLMLIARAASGQWPLPELEKKFAEACAHLATRAPSA